MTSYDNVCLQSIDNFALCGEIRKHIYFIAYIENHSNLYTKCKLT